MLLTRTAFNVQVAQHDYGVVFDLPAGELVCFILSDIGDS